MEKTTSLLAACAVAAGTLAGCATPGGRAPADGPDPYLWLEEVQGAKPLDWVRERNAASAAVIP